MTEPTEDGREWSVHAAAFKIDPTNPHNEQLAMWAREDLNSLLLSVEGVLEQADRLDTPLASVLAVVAMGIGGMDEDVMARTRLCSILALALVHLCAVNRAAEANATIARWLREVARLEVPDAPV